MAFLAAAMRGIGDLTSERQFSAPWIPWANVVTRFFTYTLVAFLAAQVRLQFEAEYERATHDPLTGLQNRRAFLQAGAEEVARSTRYSHSIAVIFLDLDEFKKLNDTRGHDSGDEALRRAAEALLSALRTSDRIARLGGDEFAVLLPEIGYDAALEAGRKAHAAMNTALERYPPVTVSAGVAWFESTDRLFPEMVKAADELMYEVKKSGKARMLSRRIAGKTEPDQQT
jgi:diguanylate cyclase (GGDEF)-like protein